MLAVIVCFVLVLIIAIVLVGCSRRSCNKCRSCITSCFELRLCLRRSGGVDINNRLVNGTGSGAETAWRDGILWTSGRTIFSTGILSGVARRAWKAITHTTKPWRCVYRPRTDKKLSYRRETARQLPTSRGGGARPSSSLPLRPLWLHLCVWSNPKATTYLRQACFP